MSTKSPGELFHDAWCHVEHAYSGWHLMSEGQRFRWEAAAQAVMPVIDDAMIQRACGAFLDHPEYSTNHILEPMKAALRAALEVKK